MVSRGQKNQNMGGIKAMRHKIIGCKSKHPVKRRLQARGGGTSVRLEMTELSCQERFACEKARRCTILVTFTNMA